MISDARGPLIVGTLVIGSLIERTVSLKIWEAALIVTGLETRHIHLPVEVGQLKSVRGSFVESPRPLFADLEREPLAKVASLLGCACASPLPRPPWQHRYSASGVCLSRPLHFRQNPFPRRCLGMLFGEMWLPG